jgi:hypothetical protein
MYGEKTSFEDAKVTVTEFLDDFYDDAEDVAPIEIGGRKWEGFTATSLGTKICVLYTGDDPAGDQFCANVWLDMSGEGKDVLATDDPALIAILGSVKVN